MAKIKNRVKKRKDRKLPRFDKKQIFWDIIKAIIRVFVLTSYPEPAN